MQFNGVCERWTFLAALALPLGCHFDDSEFDAKAPAAIEEPGLPPLPQDAPPGPDETELVSELLIDGVRVQFYAVPMVIEEAGTLPDGTVISAPTESVMIFEHGVKNSANPVSEVRMSREGGVTSAELWVGLTGTPELLPTRLADLQGYEAWALGRDSVALADTYRVPPDPYTWKAGGWDDQATFLKPIAGFLQTGIQVNRHDFGDALVDDFWTCTGRTNNMSFTGAGLGDQCQKTLRKDWVRIGIANTRAAVGVHPGFHGPADFHVTPYYSDGDGVWRAMVQMDLKPLHWTAWDWSLPTPHGLAFKVFKWDLDSSHAVRFFTSWVVVR